MELVHLNIDLHPCIYQSSYDLPYLLNVVLQIRLVNQDIVKVCHFTIVQDIVKNIIDIVLEHS
jgi:hypothetical protein